MEADEEIQFVTSKEMYQELILQYRDKGYEYLRLANECLANKSADAVVKFIRIYQDPDVLKYYVSSLAELSYGHILAAITSDEIQKLQCPHFILNGNSIEELKVILKKIEFRLWETEFGCGEDAEQRLYECIHFYQVTPEALKRVIEVGGLNKKDCYIIFTCIFLDHQELENALRMLEYGLENFPEDGEICRMLVELCGKMGKRAEQERYEERLRCIRQ